MTDICGIGSTLPTFTESQYSDLITSSTTKPYITRFSNEGNPWENIINTNNEPVSTVLNDFTTKFLMRYAPAIDNLNQFKSNTNNIQQEFSNKSKLLRDSLKEEYCFYYSRYIAALKELLNATSSATIERLKTVVAALNKKLNTITLVVNKILEMRTVSIAGYHDNTKEHSLNSLNENLKLAREKLAANSERLEKQDLAADIQSSMTDYSLEKNESSRNMLAIYGFMNIVAVGMLFYLYTNVK
jgi:hypothetical protein